MRPATEQRLGMVAGARRCILRVDVASRPPRYQFNQACVECVGQPGCSSQLTGCKEFAAANILVQTLWHILLPGHGLQWCPSLIGQGCFGSNTIFGRWS